MQFENASVLITGASQGLGRALAQALAAGGARVVLVARGEPALAEAVRALRRSGAEAHALVADVAAPDAGARIAGAARAMVGPLDVLIHNASSLGPVPLRPLADTREAELVSALRTNLIGPFMLTRAVVGEMVRRERGLVVHVSSDAAVEAYPAWGAYGASKAALDQLSRIWAAELAGSGVRVLSIDPGEMDTAMHAAALPDADRAALAAPAQVAAQIMGLLTCEPPAPTGARLVVQSPGAEVQP